MSATAAKAIAVETPRDLAEALALLADARANRHLLAGGTDLMVELEIGRTRPAAVVDLSRLAELRGIGAEAGGVRIGALSTCTDLLASPLVRARADLLAVAAAEVGAVQIQNRATLGGNLGTASPAADLNPVLVALGAVVRLASARGERDLAADEFLAGYRATARRLDELIHSVWIPPRPAGERRAFRKVGTRRAQSIAKVVIALALAVESGRIARLRAAAGSVAPQVVRLRALERELVGRAPDAHLLRRAARAAAREDAAPIDDVRSTARYRRLVLERLLVTLLAGAAGIPRDDHGPEPA
jgi:carbon-monoxide dehydrogenase medium subunit